MPALADVAAEPRAGACGQLPATTDHTETLSHRQLSATDNGTVVGDNGMTCLIAFSLLLKHMPAQHGTARMSAAVQMLLLLLTVACACHSPCTMSQ
jgi:hypothetical protein